MPHLFVSPVVVLPSSKLCRAVKPFLKIEGLCSMLVEHGIPIAERVEHLVHSVAQLSFKHGETVIDS